MLPNDLRFAESHEWVKIDGDIATVGISAFAVETLSDLTFLDLPEVGENLGQGDRFGEIESVKAVSELFTPVAGEVTKVNDSLTDDLEQLQKDPYGAGWMIKLRVSNGSLDHLLDPAGYEKHVAEESH